MSEPENLTITDLLERPTRSAGTRLHLPVRSRRKSHWQLPDSGNASCCGALTMAMWRACRTDAVIVRRCSAREKFVRDASNAPIMACASITPVAVS